MTRDQHEAWRGLEAAQGNVLRVYGWQPAGSRWKHGNAPKANPAGYTTRDAMALTMAEPLRYGYGARGLRSGGAA